MSQVQSAAAHDHSHGGHHVHRDYEGAKIGMWLFLFSEVLLFGGLFLIYATYRFLYPHDYHEAAKELNIFFGTVNTLILLTSSLTMALSIAAIQKKNKTMSLVHLGITIACALAFLVNKSFEWGHKFEHGIYPNSPKLLEKPKGEIMFFGLYYMMTGLHTFHVIVGVVILSTLGVFIVRNKITDTYYTQLENGGLYWHLVDLIWIFLFPLFYLLH
jgi:cytochrome c oxidase subunit 3